MEAKQCKPLELQFEILPMLRPTEQIAHHSKFSRKIYKPENSAGIVRFPI